MGTALSSDRTTWPTPSAGLFNDAEAMETWKARNARLQAKGYNGNGMGMPLTMAVKLWPTTTVGDAKSSGQRSLPGSKAHPGTSLCDATQRVEGGRLSPAWVECLMGFPPGWTVPVGPPLVEHRSTHGSRLESADVDLVTVSV